MDELEFKEKFLNDTMFETKNNEEAPQEELGLKPLFLDELEREMEKNNQPLSEVMEQPVAVTNVTERTNLATNEAEVVNNVSEQEAYQVLSTTAEQRAELLAAGTPMPPQERELYIQQHTRWRELTQTKIIKDFDAEQKGNQEVLRKLSNELNADQQEASDSFQAVKDTFQLFMNQMNTERQLETGEMSSEQFAEYIGNYQATVQAANEYLESHKSHRWSSKGRQRKKLVSKIAETLAEREKYISSMQLAVEMFEELRRQQEANQGELSEQDELYDTVQDTALTIQQIQAIIANGSCRERIRAFYQLCCQKSEYDFQAANHNAPGMRNNQMDELLAQLTNRILKSPIHEQAEGMMLLFALEVKAEKTAETMVTQYFQEAPIGVNGVTYAALKFYHSQGMYKSQGLQMMKERLAGPFMEMYERQFMNTYREQRENPSPILEQIPMNAEQRNAYMEQIPKEYKSSFKDKNEETRLEWLKKSGFAQPNYMDPLLAMYQELQQDEEDGSESFQQIKRTMKTFIELPHFEAKNNAEYKQLYENCIDALEAYANTHKGYRFSNKGKRRQGLVKNILECMYGETVQGKTLLQSNAPARELINQKVTEQIQRGEITEEQKKKLEKASRFHEARERINERWNVTYPIVNGEVVMKPISNDAPLREAGLSDRFATRSNVVRAIYMQRTGKSLLSEMTEQDRAQLEQIRQEVEDILSTDRNTVENGVAMITEMARGILKNRDVLLKDISSPEEFTEYAPTILTFAAMIKDFVQITEVKNGVGKNGNCGPLVLAQLTEEERMELEDIINFNECFGRAFIDQGDLYEKEEYQAYVVGKGYCNAGNKVVMEKAIQLFFNHNQEMLKTLSSSKTRDGKFRFPEKGRSVYMFWYLVSSQTEGMGIELNAAMAGAERMNNVVKETKDKSLANETDTAPILLSEMKEIIEKGSCKDKFQGLYQITYLSQTFDDIENHMLHYELSVSPALVEMHNQLCEQILNSSLEEQELYRSLIFSLETKLYEEMRSTPTAEAQKQLQGVHMLKKRLGGSFLDAYEQKVQEYWTRNSEQKEFVDGIPKIVDNQLILRDLDLLKKTGLIQGRHIDLINKMNDELIQDTDSSSESFLAIRQSLKTFIGLNHIDVENPMEYRAAYFDVKRALEEYNETHDGKRYTEKGSRRQELVRRLMEQMNLIEVDVNLVSIKKTVQENLEAKKVDGTFDDQIQDTWNRFIPYIDAPLNMDDTETIVDNAVMSNSPMQLLGACCHLETIKVKFQSCERFHEEGMVSNHEKIVEELDERLQKAIGNLPYEGILEFAQLFAESTLALHKELVNRYKLLVGNAQDDTDVKNQAYLKIINSPLSMAGTALGGLLWGLSDVASAAPVVEGMPPVVTSIEQDWNDFQLSNEVFDKACQRSSDKYMDKVRPEVYKDITQPFQNDLYWQILTSKFDISQPVGGQKTNNGN